MMESMSDGSKEALRTAKYGDNASFTDLVSALNTQQRLEAGLVQEVWNNVVPKQQGWRNLIRDVMGKLDMQQQSLYVASSGSEANVEANVEENISSQFVSLEDQLYQTMATRGGDAA